MRFVFVLVALFCLGPWLSPAHALLLGLFFAVVVGNPLASQTKSVTPKFLQLSIVGLGAGMNLEVVADVGSKGVVQTALGIGLTLALGLLLGRWFKVAPSTSMLVSVGTAICGGSAIAAVAPVIRAKPEAVSVALATVFLLNAVALVIFTPIGHWVGLSEAQFGVWSALAIHDTSSVVGSASQYGPEALQVATTLKLVRALWIVPVSIAVGMLWRHEGDATGAGKAAKPWFIAGFVLAAALVTWSPELAPAGKIVAAAARQVLVLTLFLIGAGVSRATLKNVGVRPLVQGVALWLVVASAALGAVRMGWV